MAVVQENNNFETSTPDGVRRLIPLLRPFDKTQVEPHRHNRDHMTSCLHGRIRVKLDEDEFDMTPADEPRLVKAEAWHSAWALEKNSMMLCEFAHRDEAGEIVTLVDPTRWRYDDYV